ncbi:MAG: 50S ribosomal protein L23 [Armatimonadetes bacterium]|nr:50S ribosomal protein L23 [Armatimonadota bacterium]
MSSHPGLKPPSSVAHLRGLTARDILIRPIITEKSMMGAGDNKYSFEVDKRANKIQIRNAVEEIFEKVNVIKVTTVSRRGKFRRRGKHTGFTKATKRAVVSLKPGQQIELGGAPLFEV